MDKIKLNQYNQNIMKDETEYLKDLQYYKRCFENVNNLINFSFIFFKDHKRRVQRL